ncbi:hypothetical protein CHUAL_004608 [Chamberlinius hualienensis]
MAAFTMLFASIVIVFVGNNKCNGRQGHAQFDKTIADVDEYDVRDNKIYGSSKRENDREFQIISTGINSEEIEAMLHAHNSLRAKIANGKVDGQPSASNMHKLIWDENLSKLAQDWANHCKFSHNEPIDSKFEAIGQNVAEIIKDVPDKSIIHAINNWFNEHSDYLVEVSSDSTKYPFYFNEKTGHFTQMIWATTKYVGCGYAVCEKERGYYSLIVVCNYGPSGNWRHEHVYHIGKPASECGPNGSSNEYLGLCEP